MDSRDIELMKTSWEKVTYYPESLSFFYENLFEMAPDLKRYFPEDTERQRKKLSYAIGFLIANLDRFDEFKDVIEDIGRVHNKMGINPGYYQYFINALIFTIKNEMGEEYQEEVGQTWNRVMSQVSMLMINAPEKIENRFSRFLSKMFNKEFDLSK